jgi:hypothetical protein
MKTYRIIFILIILLTGNIYAQEIKLPSPEDMNNNKFDFNEFVKQTDAKVEEILKDESYDEEELESTIGDYARWKWFWKTRVSIDPQTNKFNCARSNGIIKKQAYQTTNGNAINTIPTICNGSIVYPSNWTTIGPKQYSSQSLGFIRSIAVNPANNSIIYAGSESGGMYKTLDGGATWNNITNYLRVPGLGINDICVDASNPNVIWSITGSSHGYAVGIIKSTDAGATWSIYPIIKEDITDPDIPETFEGTTIKIDPTNSNYVWYTKGNSLFRINVTTTKTKWIWTSDQGMPFQRGLTDMELMPINGGLNTRIILATSDVNCWNGGGQLFYNDNSGVGVWNEMTPDANVERMNADFTPSTPDNLYCLYSHVNVLPFRITEVLLDGAASGAQTTFPSYIVGATSGNDFIEVTNLTSSSGGTTTCPPGPNAWDFKYLEVERWGPSGLEYTGTISPHQLNFPQNTTAVLAFGTGTDDPANRFFYLGGTANAKASGDPVGYVLWFRGFNGAHEIIDAVALNGFQFPLQSHVFDAHWKYSSPLIGVSGHAGAMLSTSDDNSSNPWTVATTVNRTNMGVPTSSLPLGNLTPVWSEKGTRVYTFSTNSWASFITSNAITADINKMEFKISNTASPVWYCGGITGSKSINQGGTWTALSMGHADIRDFDSFTSSNDIVICNDGGVSKTTGGGASTVNINGVGLNISDFTAVSRQQNNYNSLIASAMHNGNWVYNGSTWSQPTNAGGDGLYAKYLDEFPSYGVLQNNGYIRMTTNNFTSTSSAVTGPLAAGMPPDQFSQCKFLLYPSNPPSLYVGSHDIFMFPNMGSTSNFNLSNFANVVNCMDDNVGNALAAFDVALSDQSTIYATFGGPHTNSPCPSPSCGNPNVCPQGMFFKTINGGSTWTDKTDKLPVDNGNISIANYLPPTDIQISPTDPDKIWITFGSFAKSTTPYIYRVIMSTDGGNTWVDYSDGLYNVPANCIVYQKFSNDALYIGTDAGVFYRDATMAAWECFNGNLPVGIITDIDLNYCEQKISAAVYTGGIWVSNMYNASTVISGTTNWNTPRTLIADLTIPASSTLNITSSVRINAGKKIIVSPGATLLISNGYLTNNCSQMWGGIYVMAGGTVKVSNNSVIENAEYGIYAYNSSLIQSYISVDNSEFRSDYIGIYISPNPNLYNLHLEVINNASFTCPHVLIPSLNISPIGSKTFAGIEIHDFNGAIGKIGLPTILFSDLNNGIYSVHCNLAVYTSHFDRINLEPIYASAGYPNGGKGIYATDPTYSLSNLSVGVNDQNCAFTNCDEGIHSEITPVTIAHVAMVNVNSGIFVGNLIDRSMSQIYFNDIRCYSSGVTSSYQNDITTLEILENNITQRDPLMGQGYGIGSFDIGSKPRNIWIMDNIITIVMGTNGIELNGTMNNNVLGNSVDVSTDPPDLLNAGIDVLSSDWNFINCNTVVGPNALIDQPDYGFFVSKSNENEIACNTEKQIAYGFYFQDLCPMQDKFSGNYMADNWKGLLVEQDISQQKDRGNMWYGSYTSGIEAENLNCCASFFIVAPLPTFLPTNPQPSNWFDPNGGTPYDCKSNATCGGSGGGDGGGKQKKLTQPSKDGHQINSNYSDKEVQWNANQYLLNKIITDPSLRNDSLFNNYYMSAYRTEAFDYQTIRSEIGKLDDLNENDNKKLENSMKLFRQYQTELISLDSSFSINKIDENEYDAKRNELSTKIYDIDKEVKEINSRINYDKSQQLSNIIDRNQSLSSEQVFQENEKIINQIYLTTIASDKFDFSDEQESKIYSIAHQCPASGGRAVYLARGLYNLINSKETYNDVDVCKNVKPGTPQENGKSNNSFIYPSPGNSSVNLYYSGFNGEDLHLNIYNNAFQLIESFKLDNQSTIKNINVAKWIPGLYLYNIVQDNVILSAGKFDIVH